MHPSLFDPPESAPPGPRPTAPAVIPVSRLVGSARSAVERELGLAWVSGEISGFSRAASGHCYFNLKDARAQVRCVLFRSKAQLSDVALRDGLQVEVRALPTIYEARGEFQLNVDNVRLGGVGRLYERFAERKARLEAAGWFDQARKRALPAHPRAVGIVTSARAAALRDVLTTLRRRWPALRVVIYPCAVQGSGAAAEIATAIRTAAARREVDVLIVCRGGGSIEDLWPFNEENVARAVYECSVPVISGVGHETDFTICDFVADVRAPTPTGAATMVCPDGVALRRTLATHAARWRHAMRRCMEAHMQRTDHAAQRLTHPAARLRDQQRELARIALRMKRCHAHRLQSLAARAHSAGRTLGWALRRPLPQRARVAHARDAFLRAARGRLDPVSVRLEALRQNLEHLDPSAVLARGYAIVATHDGDIVTDSARLALDEELKLTLARGGALVRVTGKT